MPASSRFWDRIAERYARKPVPDEAVYQRKLAITRDYFRPEMDVLEIGCGSGKTAVSHAPFVHHIHGIDGSGKMIEIARRNSHDANAANASFEQATIEGFTAADGQFDAVLALSVLHLLDDWRAIIGKVSRMLKPEGIFVTSTVCMGDSNALLKFVLSTGGRLGVIPRVQFLAPSELTQALQDAGFVIEHHWEPADQPTVFVVAKKKG